jgi:hypothetical protein
MYVMEVLFRFLVFDEFGEPIRRFATKHEAEVYCLHRGGHTIKELPKTDKDNIFRIFGD